jgi:hypothetical protein
LYQPKKSMPSQPPTDVSPAVKALAQRLAALPPEVIAALHALFGAGIEQP